jgi:hypothetical protein
MNYRILILAAAVAALAVSPALAQNRYMSWTGAELLQRWGVLNGECRGDNIAKSCDERNLVDSALFAHGYCFVGNFGYTERWEKGPKSRWTRRGENAICSDTDVRTILDTPLPADPGDQPVQASNDPMIDHPENSFNSPDEVMEYVGQVQSGITGHVQPTRAIRGHGYVAQE